MSETEQKTIAALRELVARWRGDADLIESSCDIPVETAPWKPCEGCEWHAKGLRQAADEFEALLGAATDAQPCECDSTKGIMCDAHNPIMREAEKVLFAPAQEEGSEREPRNDPWEAQASSRASVLEEALERIVNGDSETNERCYCECKDENCCEKVGEYCPWCIARAALSAQREEQGR
jgi:hypothetical protein